MIPKAGEHAIIIGQNGSGKTAFACWMLERIPTSPIVIYDTKVEPKFLQLPGSRLCEEWDEVLAARDDASVDYIVMRPHAIDSRNPRYLDALLYEHYDALHGVGAYIDELYTFQINGRAGPGLTSLMTRGRSRGISVIGSSQRPVRVDRFVITESKKAFIFRLNDRADKRRLDDLVPNFSKLVKPVKHAFYYYAEGMDEARLMAPVKLRADLDTGQTDVQTDVASAPDADGNGAAHPADNLPVRIWL